MSASPPDSARRLILVVDDEPSVRAMVLTAIRVRGAAYSVVEAGTAEEAVLRFGEAPPDLVLLDVALPDNDGFWVCAQLKALSSETPVVMLTAMGLPSDRDRALAAGADGYIVKPFSPRALLEELDKYFR